MEHFKCTHLRLIMFLYGSPVFSDICVKIPHDFSITDMIDSMESMPDETANPVLVDFVGGRMNGLPTQASELMVVNVGLIHILQTHKASLILIHDSQLHVLINQSKSTEKV